MHEAEEVEDFLAHFGVKGMRWGVRNNPNSVNPSAGLKKIEKKLDKLDGNVLLNGRGLEGWGAQKQFKKLRKKDPDFQFKNLSPEEKIAYRKKSVAIARRAVIRRGAIESAAILAGYGGLKASNILDAKSMKMVQTGVTFVLASQAIMVGTQLRSLNQVTRQDELFDERKRLTAELEKGRRK